MSLVVLHMHRTIAVHVSFNVVRIWALHHVFAVQCRIFSGFQSMYGQKYS